MNRKETKRLLLIAAMIILLLLIAVMLATQIFAAETEPPAEVPEVPAEEGGISAWIEENKTDIISIFTLIGSVMVAALYKMGLLPAISKFMKSSMDTSGKLQESVDIFKTDTQEKLKECFEAISSVAGNAAEMEKMTSDMRDLVSSLTESIQTVREDQKQQDEVLRHFAGMLYKVVMSSSAPEYIRSDVAKEFGAVVDILQPVGTEAETVGVPK